MNSALITIMNLPKAARKLVALLMTLILLGLLAMAVAVPLKLVMSKKQELEFKREQLGKIERSIESSQVADRGVGSIDETGLFLKGDDEGVIQANLQSRLSSLASRHGVEISSVAAATSYENDGIRYVGISTNLSGDIAAIHNTIFAIENSVPTLFVMTARLSAARRKGQTASDKKPMLQVRLSIFGASDPNLAEDS